MKKKQFKGVIALIILAFVFASMGVFARYLNVSFELFEQTYLRIGLAFCISILLFSPKVNFKNYLKVNPKDLGIFLFRAFFLYLGVVLITEAIIHTKFTNASLLAIVPLMPFLGYFLLGEKIKLQTLGIIFIGFFGALLILVQDLSQMYFGYGEIMALLSVIAFDLSYIGRKWHSDELNNYETTIIIFFFGSIMLFMGSIIAGEGLPQSQDFSMWIIWILIIAAIFNVINLYLTNYGFQHVKVAVAGNILTLEVVFALIYGFVLFQEVPSLRELFGGFIILSSVYFVNKFEN